MPVADATGLLAGIELLPDGTARSSGPVTLPADCAAFERGHEDRFHIELPDVGAPTKLRIGHDNSGVGSAWHLAKARAAQPRRHHLLSVARMCCAVVV